MSDPAEVLFANESFYHYFREADLEGMESLWARAAPVACIHPGWPALTDREEIMESWRGIFANEGAGDFACEGPVPYLSGPQAFVVCYERFGDTLLVATNIFQQEDGAWKLVHHQAGPCNVRPKEKPEEWGAGTVQ